ncbi:GNAT family N-acetyltransferase [Spongisporangium articulatum]|uniref:GNAT family N-acetyltransferase n=1 Tax=Spongisporangium articulatum TaxID=3362603 RepID=A0ABW8AJZ4_9ACTN
MTVWRVRPATPDDVTAIDGLIRELAEYEREPDAVEATPADLHAALFSPSPRLHCHVAEVDGRDGPAVVGMALWFVTYSTWRGRHGIWLEDLFVSPTYRALGLGRALLSTLARVCTERGYARLEWTVLDWNEPAHAFYRRIGAAPHEGWSTWRLGDDAIRQLAGSSS